eukprot:3941308-Rhodomonas_salina.1
MLLGLACLLARLLRLLVRPALHHHTLSSHLRLDTSNNTKEENKLRPGGPRVIAGFGDGQGGAQHTTKN